MNAINQVRAHIATSSNTLIRAATKSCPSRSLLDKSRNHTLPPQLITNVFIVEEWFMGYYVIDYQAKAYQVVTITLKRTLSMQF